MVVSLANIVKDKRASVLEVCHVLGVEYLGGDDYTYIAGYWCAYHNPTHHPIWMSPHSQRLWEMGYADGKGDLEDVE